MRDALPNATFVGFTGTPLINTDTTTKQIFSNYADIYDIRQTVANSATMPLYYEPRIVKLSIDEAGASKAEAVIAEAAKADEAGREEIAPGRSRPLWRNIDRPGQARAGVEHLHPIQSARAETLDRALGGRRRRSPRRGAGPHGRRSRTLAH